MMTRKDYSQVALKLKYARKRYSTMEWHAAYRVMVEVFEESFDNFDREKFERAVCAEGE